MMGRLSRNEVDIGLVDLYVTHVRIAILDYTTPYDSEVSGEEETSLQSLDVSWYYALGLHCCEAQVRAGAH
ncbi:hypothetical protein E2C01_076612 [Portunus trituberculatus]|uniref:Uncharacterized protein n=1 Tax=Portunus trituberculatus TaxID=210409 RepID=A0A5B7IC20_PORTR|nr:hypothetical protein [Portunus trituberculatus]